MKYNADSQIAAFLQRLPADTTTDLQADPSAPLTIFRGGLELTREQEESVVQAALKFKRDLELESGRDGALFNADPESMGDMDLMDIEGMKPMERRALWDLVYAQKFDWRRRLIGGIYADGQNVHFPHTRRFVQQMISRAQNYFFQTDPWFAATPVPVIAEQSIDTATMANEWAQYKLNAAEVKAVLEKAIELAFIRGECVLRIEDVKKVEYYETFANVAVDPETGEPYMAADGDFIFEADEFAMVEDVGMVLKRDGQTVLPALELTFAEQKVRRKNIVYKGPRVQIVPYRDFLAPLNCPSLDEAEFTGEYVDTEAIAIVEDYIERLEERGEWDEKEYPRVMEFLRDVSGRPANNAESSANAARPEHGEGSQMSMADRGDSVVRTLLCHMWIDANNDGVRENIVMILDLDTERPILIDYVANVYKNRRRPYRVPRIQPVDGRWHGVSMVENFWQLQRFSDLIVARWELATSRAGKVVLWNPQLTVEGAGNPNLQLNTGMTYTKANPQTKAEEILEVIALYDFEGQDLQNLLSYVNQMMTNLSGVANANDAAMAGLDTSRLATGVKNIDRSGQEQFAPLLSHLTPGLEKTVEDCVYLAVAHSEDNELFHVMGPQGALILRQLAGSDLRQFTWTISLEMTRYRAEQEAEQSAAAIETAMQYYSIPDPALRLQLAPLFRQRLKAFGVRDVDTIIALPTEADFAAAQQAALQQQAQPAPAQADA